MNWGTKAGFSTINLEMLQCARREKKKKTKKNNYDEKQLSGNNIFELFLLSAHVS
jgi:hypothetical protein